VSDTGPGGGRPLRLIHITTTDMSLDWLLRPQLEAFAAAGYEVIGASATGSHVAALVDSGIRHEPIHSFTRASNPLRDLAAIPELVRLFRRLRPDIVHTHNPKPGVLGRIIARLCRVPLVVNTQHGLYAQPDDRWQRRLPVYAVERLAAAFSHVELVQNPEDVDTLVRRLHVPERRVRLLGNGIDLARFDPATIPPSRRAEVRREWGLDDGDVVIGVVGRLVAEKGVAELIEAAAHLRTAAPTARMVIIGPHEHDKADAVAEHLIRQGEQAGVVFAGRRDDMPDCYAAMDLFATATWREGFPRAAMEASAMGLAVVATDVRGCRQVVDPGVTGRLVPVRNPRALADALTGLVEDVALRTSMGAAARDRARLEFDQQRVIERTLDAYRSAPGRQRSTEDRQAGR
jgi:glycosyltransferase involved in cell wall biosynthesis